ASKKPRRRWPARLPAAQREEVLRSGFLLAARRSAGRMLGLELLPLLPAGLLLRFHRGHLRLLRRGQHVVDLCADVGHLLHASGGGGAFGLGQRSGGGLVAGVGRVHRLERLPLLAQPLPPWSGAPCAATAKLPMASAELRARPRMRFLRMVVASCRGGSGTCGYWT